RPIGADGTPLVGPLPGRPGLWLATGHGPWGILEAPATGELLADLLLDRTPRLDPSPFDPARPAAGP
ncbi:MAG: FAD-dependent oxidoreductase, partial [Geminicoccaceae bacterium]|nr:FAD-dependent oxidoreductase [Geminicoccaceae bacterium]MDW8371559.1 FAD-dependent oxidoreductase [Geminicoccaceae bacterium]